MFKNRRLIRKELDAYYDEHKQSLFYSDDSDKVKLKSIWYVYIILILSILGVYYVAYKYNLFGLNLLTSQIIVLMLIILNVVLMYVRYYKNRLKIYKAIINKNPNIFKKVYRVNALLIIVYLIIYGLFAHLVFIKGTLNPPIEGCSYYDWYGNILYDSKIDGYCPELNNVEIIINGNKRTLSFGIEHLTYYDTYERYEYKYENNLMVERTVEYFDLESNMHKLPYDKKLMYTSKIQRYFINRIRMSSIWRRHNSIKEYGYDISKIDEIDMTPILVDTLSNTYNVNEFTSERIIKLNSEVYEERTVHSFIDDDSNINITYTSLLDGERHLILENISKQNDSYYRNYYYTTSFHDNTKEISIRTISTYDYSEKKALNKTYNILEDLNLINVDEKNLLMINNYSYVNNKYSFKTYTKFNNYRIDHYAKNVSGEEKLFYRNIVTDEDFGFKVTHYSYKRVGDLPQSNLSKHYPSFGKSIEFERVYIDNTCYRGYYEDIKDIKRKDIKYSLMYNYDIVTRDEYKCNVELFYQNYPVLLNY